MSHKYRNTSLNASLFYKMITNQNFLSVFTKDVIKSQLNVPFENALKYNITAKDMLKDKKKVYLFVKDIVIAWCDLNFHVPGGKNETLQQIPWYNSHIKVAGKVYYHNTTVMEVILNMENIYCEQTGAWMTHQQLVAHYPNIQFNFFAVFNAYKINS